MRPHEFAKRIGVNVQTLRRWDSSGRLVAKRTPSNHRYYTEEDVLSYYGEKAKIKRKVVVYCRVSSQKQKSDLRNQREAMERFCIAKGLEVDEWVDEIGGGLNFKRRQFLRLVQSAITGEVEAIVVAHKDRLCRFAFDLVEGLTSSAHCEIIVANQESLSPQQELVEDLMTIIHCFSCRLYGSRTYANKKTREIAGKLDNPMQGELNLSRKVQC